MRSTFETNVIGMAATFHPSCARCASAAAARWWASPAWPASAACRPRRLLLEQGGGDQLLREPARRAARPAACGGDALAGLHRHAADAAQPLRHALPAARRGLRRARLPRTSRRARATASFPWQMGVVVQADAAAAQPLLDRVLAGRLRKRRQASEAARRTAGALLAALFGTADAAAQPCRSFRPGAEMAPLRIDGRLDDAAWAAAPLHEAFVQYLPLDRQPVPAGYRTTLQLVIEEHALVVGIRAWDPRPEEIRAPLMRRDKVERDQDFVSVLIDPMGTRRAAQFVRVSAAGVVADGMFLPAPKGGGLRARLRARRRRAAPARRLQRRAAPAADVAALPLRGRRALAHHGHAQHPARGRHPAGERAADEGRAERPRRAAGDRRPRPTSPSACVRTPCCRCGPS